MSENNLVKFEIDETLSGERLDKAISLQGEIGSRSRAEHLIDQQAVFVNGQSEKSSYKVKFGDQIEIKIPQKISDVLEPYDFKIDILFEDEHLIVVNKPAGLVVHPAAGHANDTLVNALLHHTKNLSMKFGDNRPGIVHRLDRDTSGILVVAKDDRTHENLAQQFKKRTVHRIYFAVVMGNTPKPSGVIQSYLARHPTDRKRFASVLSEDHKIVRTRDDDKIDGKWSITNYEVLGNFQSTISYLKLKLETGRTHQIRVHLTEIGVPIVGDLTYGANRKITHIKNRELLSDVKSLNRFLLHAGELGFNHPVSNEFLSFKIDWPDNILPLIKKWGFHDHQ